MITIVYVYNVGAKLDLYLCRAMVFLPQEHGKLFREETSFQLIHVSGGFSTGLRNWETLLSVWTRIRSQRCGKGKKRDTTVNNCGPIRDQLHKISAQSSWYVEWTPEIWATFYDCSSLWQFVAYFSATDCCQTKHCHSHQHQRVQQWTNFSTFTHECPIRK